MLPRRRTPPQRRRKRSLVSSGRTRSKTLTRVSRLTLVAPQRRPTLQFRWLKTIPPEAWSVYQLAMDSLRQAGIPFMIGGGFALATFVGRWRDTKDIDLYIHPADRDAAVTAITQSGFDDYYSRRPYDRKWIYRSVRENVIADLIWAMANQRAQVDQLWFERAGSLTVRNQKLLVLPPEEFLWCKLYIMQRDHCDWTDVFNLIYAIGPQIDWGHVIDRLDDDLQLLRGLLMAYSWLCPKEVLRLPAALWKRLSLLPPRKQKCAPLHDRIRLLDSRQWFAATIPANAKLEV